jgi:hypothetical protein
MSVESANVSSPKGSTKRTKRINTLMVIARVPLPSAVQHGVSRHPSQGASNERKPDRKEDEGGQGDDEGPSEEEPDAGVGDCIQSDKQADTTQTSAGAPGSGSNPERGEDVNREAYHQIDGFRSAAELEQVCSHVEHQPDIRRDTCPARRGQGCDHRKHDEMLRDSEHSERHRKGCGGGERGISQGGREVGSQVQREEDSSRVGGVGGCSGTWGVRGTHHLSPPLIAQRVIGCAVPASFIVP